METHFISGDTKAVVICSCGKEIPAGTPEAGNRLAGMFACYECSKKSVEGARDASRHLHLKLSGKPLEKIISLPVLQ